MKALAPALLVLLLSSPALAQSCGKHPKGLDQWLGDPRTKVDGITTETTEGLARRVYAMRWAAKWDQYAMPFIVRCVDQLTPQEAAIGCKQCSLTIP